MMVMLSWLILLCPVVDKHRSRLLAKRGEESHQSAAWANKTLCSTVGARQRGQAGVSWSRLGSTVNRLPQWPAVMNVTHTYTDSHTLSNDLQACTQQWPVTVTDSLCCPDLHFISFHMACTDLIEQLEKLVGKSSRHLNNALSNRHFVSVQTLQCEIYVWLLAWTKYMLTKIKTRWKNYKWWCSVKTRGEGLVWC